MESVGGALYHSSAGIAFELGVLLLAVRDPLKLILVFIGVLGHQQTFWNPHGVLRSVHVVSISQSILKAHKFSIVS